MKYSSCNPESTKKCDLPQEDEFDKLSCYGFYDPTDSESTRDVIINITHRFDVSWTIAESILFFVHEGEVVFDLNPGDQFAIFEDGDSGYIKIFNNEEVYQKIVDYAQEYNEKAMKKMPKIAMVVLDGSEGSFQDLMDLLGE